MKKVVLLLLTIVLITFSVKAQQPDSDLRDQLRFGLKLGANLSNVYDSQGEEFSADPKLGLVTGAFLSIPIGKYLGVQPELLFSQKGFKATGVILGSTYQFTRTTSYIDIPILISLKPSKHVTLLAGPQFSYLIRQRDLFADGTTTIEQEEEFTNDNLRRNILCFTGGIDFNLNNLVIGTRVGWDLMNNNGDGTSTTPRYKNVWYQGTLGFRF